MRIIDFFRTRFQKRLIKNIKENNINVLILKTIETTRSEDNKVSTKNAVIAGIKNIVIDGDAVIVERANSITIISIDQIAWFTVTKKNVRKKPQWK